MIQRITIVVLALLLIAGCGSDDEAGTTTTDPSATVEGSLQDDSKRSKGKKGKNKGSKARDAAAIEQPPADRQPLSDGDKVIVFGDSLSVAGGDRPYPERLSEATGLDLEVVNLGEPGTTTADWLPGGQLFDGRLAPALDGAEVVLFTLGGNDIEKALGAASGPDGIDAARRVDPGRLIEEAQVISERMREVVSAVRERAGGARVVYVSYPNYAQAPSFRERLSPPEAFGFRIALQRLNALARQSGADLVVDMLAVTSSRNVEALLADAEHLNDQGHELYAQRVAALIQ